MSKYEGLLSKNWDTPTYGMQIEHTDCDIHDYAKERETSLFNHYDIERSNPNSWRDLALALAEDHVPAYQKPRGRPQKNFAEDMRWLVLFLAFRKVEDCSCAEAYCLVAKRVGKDSNLIEERLKTFRRRKRTSYDWKAIEFYGLSTSIYSEQYLESLLGVDETLVNLVEVESFHEQTYSRYPYGPQYNHPHYYGFKPWWKPDSKAMDDPFYLSFESSNEDKN